jgi:uncharacterized membrane protein YciS (DUF1049 family)
MTMGVKCSTMLAVEFRYGIVEHANLVTSILYFQVSMHLLETRSESRVTQVFPVMITFY